MNHKLAVVCIRTRQPYAPPKCLEVSSTSDVFFGWTALGGTEAEPLPKAYDYLWSLTYDHSMIKWPKMVQMAQKTENMSNLTAHIPMIGDSCGLLKCFSLRLVDWRCCAWEFKFYGNFSHVQSKMGHPCTCSVVTLAAATHQPRGTERTASWQELWDFHPYRTHQTKITNKKYYE